MSLKKADLVANVMQKASLSRADSKRAVDAILEGIEDELREGNKINLVGFGSFQVKDQAARTGRNPQTGEDIHIPAKKVVRFSPGKGLKEAVQAP